MLNELMPLVIISYKLFIYVYYSALIDRIWQIADKMDWRGPRIKQNNVGRHFWSMISVRTPFLGKMHALFLILWLAGVAVWTRLRLSCSPFHRFRFLIHVCGSGTFNYLLHFTPLNVCESARAFHLNEPSNLAPCRFLNDHFHVLCVRAQMRRQHTFLSDDRKNTPRIIVMLHCIV